jgi:hypothetical protein
MSGTTSGTYLFNPSGSDLVIEAYERCGLDDFEPNAKHFQSARRSMNFVNVLWTNRGINLWKVTLASAALSVDQSTVTVDPSVVGVLDTYLNYGGAWPSGSDILLFPLSRNDYAALPEKLEPGRVTSYWFDRTVAPTIRLWPVPDQTGYTLYWYQWQRQQDADPTGGQTVDVQYQFLEAYAAALAAHLSMKWSPDRFAALDAYAQRCWMEAADENREKVPFRLSPDLSSYFN